MNKRLHILIAEPSEIIRSGLSCMIQRISSLSADIVELSDVSSLMSLPNIASFDIIIANPSLLGVFSPSSFRAEINNDSIKVLALQSSFAEQNIVQHYDGVISLYDSCSVIKDKICETVKVSEEQDKRKELSIREKEIIVCVVKGMTNKMIADNLCLSTHTVVTHRRNIATKLQIHSPSGLTIYAIVNKLVDLTDIKDSIHQGFEAEGANE